MIHVREKPPLRLHYTVQSPTGKLFRWAQDEPLPANVPNGERFSDTMPGGFESFDCTLPRKVGFAYEDLELFSEIKALGAGGAVAWEGRLERTPRVSGLDEFGVSPSAVGHQAHLEDDKSVTALHIDRDLTHWSGMSVARRSTVAAIPYGPLDGRVTPDSVTGVPAIALEVQGAWTILSRPLVEMWYDAGSNRVPILDASWTSISINHADANWYFKLGVADDDDGTNALQSADLAGVTPPTNTSFVPASAKRWAFIELWYATGPAGADNSLFALNAVPVVYGDHGMTLRGSGYASYGYFGSDIIAHTIASFAPLLRTTPESVRASSFVIEHSVFSEQTTAGEIVRQTTRFGLQDWAVWDNRVFWWHERGTHGKRWRARIRPAQLQETGPQVDRVWNSIMVQYQDVDGTTRTVGPPGSNADTEDAVLQDVDSENPANQVGITRRDMLTMGVTTAAGAVEVGRRFLEESKLLNSSGAATLVGHAEDDRGVLHPYWRVRSGDYISFVDAADTSYRRIIRTDKDVASRSCSIDLDSPPEGLQALLERLGAGLVSLGL